MNSPYLSFVIVGRNDDYGVNFMSRLNTFVRSLDRQVKNFPGLFELIIVEWNPLGDRPGLDKTIDPPKNLHTRIITVPADVHDTIGHSKPVLEYYGKNVGIRRANGKFVLATNPDIIFTDELIEELAKQNLDPANVYRTDRYDFISDGITSVEPENYVRYALDRTFYCCLEHKSVPTEVTFGRSLDSLPVSVKHNLIVHTNASGDFILAAKEAFFQVNGMWESVSKIYHNDSLSYIRLMFLGQRIQKVFTSPKCIFHQHHDRQPIKEKFSPSVAREEGSKPGPDNWGLKNFDFPENILNN